MKIELITKDDIRAVEKRLEDIESLLRGPKPSTGLPRRLTFEQILSRLQIKDRISFYRRRESLLKFGLFKEGKRYYMFEDDLERYMRSLRDKAIGINYSKK